MSINLGDYESASIPNSTAGVCRVCGTQDTLTIEHILPRAAGGGKKTKIFTGDEFIKATVRKEELIGTEDDDKPYGLIKQNGFAESTLCRSCNNHSGKHYDEEFAKLYNAMAYFVSLQAKSNDRPPDQSLDDYLAGKGAVIKLAKLKPNNIAKRVLVAFCSIDHPGLTDRNPEIRRAIMDKEYKPDTQGFSIYFTPHIGSSGYFGTLVALGGDGVIHSYAGLEIGSSAFYLSDHDAHLKGGGLAGCIDITSWLTDYDYGEEAGELEIHANFEKSLALNVPAWAFE